MKEVVCLREQRTHSSFWGIYLLSSVADYTRNTLTTDLSHFSSYFESANDIYSSLSTQQP